MYWQTWTKGKVNYKDIKDLKTDQRLIELMAFSNKYKHSEEWREVISYVLKHEVEQQYSMLSDILQQLHASSKIALGNALDSLTDEWKLCRNMGTFYLCMKYLTSNKSYLRNLTAVKHAYGYLIEKHSLYEKDILALEDISPLEYPRGLIMEVTSAIEALPKIFEAFSDKLNLECTNVILSWLSVFPQQTKQQVLCLSKFCAFLSVEVVQLHKYNFSYNREAVMKLVMQVIAHCQLGYPRNENLAMVLQHLPESAINSLDETSDIINTDVSKIIMTLNTITKATITAKTLRFVYVVSDCFKKDQDYHALHRIYKDFILPQLVCRGKAINATAQSELQRVIQFYIHGFLDHAGTDIGDLEYFVAYSRLISRKNMGYWLKLALIVSHGNDKLKNHLKELTADLIKGPLDELLKEEDYFRLMQNSWEMQRDDLSHERKKYALTQTKNISGIQNPSSNCYIISAMQALYLTKLFPEFLRSYSKELTEYDSWSIMSSKIKLKLLYQLNTLMKDLKDCRSLIKVESVKANGPEQFQKNPQQQDCHEYLIQLFDSMEKQIAKMSTKTRPAAVNDFKSLFELGTEWELVCQGCNTAQKQIVYSNMHSIGVHQHLSFEWIDHVAHTCDKCGVKNPEREQKFKVVKFPQILLVHLKRFEFKNDQSIKKLGVSDIPRKFQNYKLMGFITHIGRNARCGHYVFYGRKQDNPLVWYQFNDSKVFEFKLATEGELFERNFKASNTPYILVYKMNKS